MDSATLLDPPVPGVAQREPPARRGGSAEAARSMESLLDEARAIGLGLADVAAEEIRPSVVRYTFVAFAVGFAVGRLLR